MHDTLFLVPHALKNHAFKIICSKHLQISFSQVSLTFIFLWKCSGSR